MSTVGEDELIVGQLRELYSKKLTWHRFAATCPALLDRVQTALPDYDFPEQKVNYILKILVDEAVSLAEKSQVAARSRHSRAARILIGSIDNAPIDKETRRWRAAEQWPKPVSDAIRHKVTLQLAELCSDLSPDLGLAARVAFNLHEEADAPFLQGRVERLASFLSRDEKTARRRIDEAFTLLSEKIAGSGRRNAEPSEYAPDSWYFAEVQATLRMDVELPQLTDERRIVSKVDGLDEIVIALWSPKDSTVPESDRRIRADAMYGGRIVEEIDPSNDYARFVLRLPRPLKLGHYHDYGVQFTSYPRALMQPFLTFTPLQRCDLFRARVRFGNGYIPDSVWRVGGVPLCVLSCVLVPQRYRR